MRLINADELLEYWDRLSARSRIEFDQVIMLMSTAYDVDKVVEQLKEVHEKFCNSVTCGGKSMCKDCEEYTMFKKNIEIVKEGGISAKSRKIR